MGCIPVVICPLVGQHPVPFKESRVVEFEPFWIDFSWSTFNRRPAALLYYVHSSRVAANMLGEIRHRCFSERVVSRFAHRHLCGANLSWPYRVNLSVVSTTACSTSAE